MWVSSYLCGDCSATSYFYPLESSTYVSQKQQVQLSYGSGDCVGTLSTDVAGLESLDINSTGQNFILVTQEDDFDDGFDGILVSSR